MLKDFFRINLPYGMQKNDKNEWFAFNREYKPLGWNTLDFIDHEKLPVNVQYKNLTEEKILEIVGNNYIQRDDKTGDIIRFFLYHDSNNPATHPNMWNDYFLKIKILSSLKTD